MSWSPTIYCSFADEATARTQLGSALGLDLASPKPVAGDGVHSVVVPFTQWATAPTKTSPGTAASGYWVMLRLDTSWAGYAAAVAALQPYVQTPVTPSNVFA